MDSTARKIILLFPGQGAQYVGMARDYLEGCDAASATVAAAEAVLGKSIVPLLLEGPDSALTETVNSQLALFITSHAIFASLKSRCEDLDVSGVAGFSLGEYNALVAAGVLAFDEALTLVERRATLMNDACHREPGAMAAILGMDDEALSALVDELSIPLWVANYNCPGQTVVSGTKEAIDLFCPMALERGARRAVPLRVHGAFHSGLMRSAEASLAPLLLSARWQVPSCPVASNATGAVTTSLSTLKDNLLRQMTSPVYWKESVASLVDAAKHNILLEVGCGRTLTGFNKRMDIHGEAYHLDKLSDLNQLVDVLRR